MCRNGTGEIMVGRLGFVEHCMVRVLCTLALFFVGFAHDPAGARERTIPASELAQYVLPDGTVADLCHSSGHDEDGHNGSDRSSGCEACRLSASILLPAPQQGAGEPVPAGADPHVAFRTEAHYRQLFPPNTAPRGPPSGLHA